MGVDIDPNRPRTVGIYNKKYRYPPFRYPFDTLSKCRYFVAEMWRKDVFSALIATICHSL